jgi:hypothetical protein
MFVCWTSGKIPSSSGSERGVSIMLIHQPGLKKIRGLVPNTGNYKFKNTMVKVG